MPEKKPDKKTEKNSTKKKGKTTKKTTGKGPNLTGESFRTLIIDEALVFAEENGWNHSSLSPLADYMGVQVNDIRVHFRDANAIANAWFTRAQDAMLAPEPEGFADLLVRDRINLLMMRWFDALAPYREVAVQILAAKTHPPHVHHWVPAIFSLSRTIQLLRSAALLHTGGRRQQVEEIGLTALFLATMKAWCRDESPGQERTRGLLDRRLKRIDCTILRFYGCARI